MRCPKCGSNKVLYQESISIAYTYKVSKNDKLYGKRKSGTDSISHYECEECGYEGSAVTKEKDWETKELEAELNE